MHDPIAPVCHNCAPRPIGLTVDDIDPLELVAKHVKLGFDTDYEDGVGPTKEHIWILITSYNGDGKFTGEVDSVPVALDLSRNDEVTFALEDIEDIYPEGES